MKTKTTLLVLLVGACAWQSRAQPTAFESSGDYLLNGTYYMRQVVYYASQGFLDESINVQGTIIFSGSGTYSFNGSVLNTTVSNTPVATAANGTYVISASGEGYISSVYSSFQNDQIVGLVSQGIFIGGVSAGSNGYSELFIAAPVGSSAATNATLTGAYTVAYMDPTFLPTSTALQGGEAFFNMTADGNGNIGNINASTYSGTNTSASSQSLSGVTYSFSNGGAQLKFGGTPNSSTLIAGTQLLYISPDGNFIFGGSYGGYDMFVGVRAATSPPSNYAGLYYQAGLDLDETTSNNGYTLLDSYYGSFKAFSGTILGHQALSTTSLLNYRNLSALSIYGGSNDFTYLDSYTLNSDGSSDDTAFAQHYVSSKDGLIRIGYGIGPLLSLNVALQAPALSGSGVYLNPVGVVNAASSVPFTAQVSPGEFLTLYGTGLAPTTDTASVPFPKTLSGVRVLIDGVAAPIYYVSPTQISVIVPYQTSTLTTAGIQVINNGVNSNLVTSQTGLSSVGVFTNDPVGGTGYAAALHPDYSVISESSPAKIGETVAVYLAGMGAVFLPVSDGVAAPSNPPSITTATPLVFLLDTSGNYRQAKVTFSGLAPGYAGLYQVNFTIPAGLVSGKTSLEIIGPDSDTFEALLPVTAP
jgi:uncharacterized protein (TIGR03437 family)